MIEKMPLIMSVKQCEPAKTVAEGWPVLGCNVETQNGPMILQLTSNAAHDLRAILIDLNLPPRMTPASGGPVQDS